MFLILVGTGCSGTPHGESAKAFILVTDAGPLLIQADGNAHGLTQSALDAAVRKGVARADRGQVRLIALNEEKPTRRMRFHVEEGFRPTRAQVTLQMFSGESLVKWVSTAAPATSAFPQAVFFNTVAGLVQQLLPAGGADHGVPES